MLKKTLTMAAALSGALVLSTAAMAAPGRTTGDVHMRTGPSTRYPVIATIPAGASVNILGCPSWCQVSYGGRRGYVSSNYVTASRGGGPVYAARPSYYSYSVPYGYAEYPYYNDYYAYGGPSIYFGFGGGGYGYGHGWRGHHGGGHGGWGHHRWPRHR